MPQATNNTEIYKRVAMLMHVCPAVALQIDQDEDGERIDDWLLLEAAAAADAEELPRWTVTGDPMVGHQYGEKASAL